MTDSLEGKTPAQIRQLCRAGAWTGMTNGAAPDQYQANLAIVPLRWAEAFRRFCECNPAPCPIIDMTAPGEPEPRHAAPGADIRTDLPRYQHLVDGVVREECADIRHLWRTDHVAFLLGCSFSFDGILRRAGVHLPHMDDTGHIGAYATNIECVAVDGLHGPMICSMRPVPAPLVEQVCAISARYPLAHGAPVHVGDPAAIGVDLSEPDCAGRIPLPLPEGSVPLFWGCGVTPQLVAKLSGIEDLIVHAPGHMLVTDLRTDG